MNETAVTVRVDPTCTLGRVSRSLLGHFAEHLHEVVYGGLWAELLVNRKFELPGPRGRLPDIATAWELVPGSGCVPRRGDRHLLALGNDAHHHQGLLFDAGAAPGGIRQTGVPIDAGCRYRVRLACSVRGRLEGLRLELVGADGTSLGAARVVLPPEARVPRSEPVLGEGVTLSVELRATGTDVSASFDIVAEPSGGEDGELWIHWVSLMPADSLDGLHRGVVELMRDLPATIVKYPGGCFADSYDWRLGIGHRDLRHGAPDPAWGTWEENDFGTDEFLHWCEQTQTIPYICVNHGTGSLDLAADWVEYCNGEVSTAMGALRAANGHSAPYGVPVWAVGNEVYGAWERGHLQAAAYASRVRDFARAMKAVDPTIRIVAQGDLGPYSEIVLAEAGPAIDLLSVHHYSRHFETALAESDVAGYLAEGPAFEAVLGRLVEAIRGTPGALHVRIALDEWGWAGPQQGLAGAAFTACVLNACLRLAPWVEIGGHCCLINPGGVADRVGQTLTANLLFDVFRLYNVAHRDHSVAVTSSSPDLDVAAYGDDAGCSVILVNAGPRRMSVAVRGIGTGVPADCRIVGRDGTRSMELATLELELEPCEVALVSTSTSLAAR